MNIVLFGDSHLGRFGKNPTAQLESLIKGSTVYNCSAGGFTSRDGARRAQLLGTLKPDAIVFSYGGNDVAPWKNIVPKEEYIANMRHIFEMFSGAQKILFVSPDVKIDDVSQSDSYNQLQHEYVADLMPVCDEFGVAIVDGSTVLLHLDGSYHEDDGIHMNEAAYAAVIGAFSDVVLSPTV